MKCRTCVCNVEEGRVSLGLDRCLACATANPVLKHKGRFDMNGEDGGHTQVYASSRRHETQAIRRTFPIR